eukprot:scpid103187/ scgid23410/ 
MLLINCVQKYEIKIKSNKWWHPIFWSLINTSICNAYLLYKVGIADHAAEVMSHSDFRAKLAEQLVQLFQRQHGCTSGRKRRASTQAAVERPQNRTVGQHLIVRVTSEVATTKPQRDCMLCKEKGKKGSRSVYECSACNVGLHPDCFKEYHTT